MPDHVAQQCLDELQRRLEWLESVRTGYTTVLADVVQPVPYTEDENFGTHLYCELFQLNVEREEELDCAANPPIVGWGHPMYAQITVAPSESGTTSINAIANEIVKDVTRAVFQDPDSAGVYEHTLGGIANGMDILPPEFIDASDEGPDVLAIGVRVNYQTRENDPSTQA
ncbi:MAG: hypothetical protein AAGI37_17925 [Planctomycetota bacterium]